MMLFNRDGKVNFVDKNNVFLGYDMNQCCCEHFGWFLAEQPTTEIQEEPQELPDISEYNFDRDYFRELHDSHLEDGGIVVFRLVSDEKELFLHLYNCHNGYYGHGFYFMVNSQLIQQGSI